MSRVTPIEHGPGRTPACARCGDASHVIRIWNGYSKIWVCSLHFQLTTSEVKERSLKDRVLRKPIEAKTVAITDVLPNRAARRRHGKALRKRA